MTAVNYNKLKTIIAFVFVYFAVAASAGCAETEPSVIYAVQVSPDIIEHTLAPVAQVYDGRFYYPDSSGATGTTAIDTMIGAELAVLRRGKVVGRATVIRSGAPSWSTNTLGVALALDPGYKGIGAFIAVPAEFATPAQNFRPEITTERIRDYHDTLVAAAGISFNANGVPEGAAKTSQPRTLNIFQPAPNAPTIIASSMIIPNGKTGCETVYNRMDCAAHSLFAVIKHKDMSLKPILLKYVNADDFAAAGLEEVVDVYDADRDGDADLITEVCTWSKCKYRIYTYENEDYILSFEGPDRDVKSAK